MAYKGEKTPKREGPRTGSRSIEGFLRGCTFPCRRDQVIRQAQENDAPDDVVANLKTMPDQKFTDMGEVLSHYATVTGSGEIPATAARKR